MPSLSTCAWAASFYFHVIYSINSLYVSLYVVSDFPSVKLDPEKRLEAFTDTHNHPTSHSISRNQVC